VSSQLQKTVSSRWKGPETLLPSPPPRLLTLSPQKFVLIPKRINIYPKEIVFGLLLGFGTFDTCKALLVGGTGVATAHKARVSDEGTHTNA
jgi:hypothetical protein